MSITPYKAHVSASFPWVESREPDSPHEEGNPGGYFHLAPGEAFVGGGMWHPPKDKLAAFRRTLDADPGRVHDVIDHPSFVATFGQINGDRLSRVPQGFDKDHPEAELLKLKDMTFGHRLADDDVTSSRLPDVLVESFAVAIPVMRLLAQL